MELRRVKSTQRAPAVGDRAAGVVVHRISDRLVTIRHRVMENVLREVAPGRPVMVRDHRRLVNGHHEKGRDLRGREVAPLEMRVLRQHRQNHTLALATWN